MFRQQHIHNLLGQRFGRLKVLEYCGLNKIKRPLWQCLCDCGATTITTGDRLRNCMTKSCGCLRADNLRGIRADDLRAIAAGVGRPKRYKYSPGDKIGQLQVVECVDRVKGKITWRCQCDCGKFVERTTEQIRSHQKKNCGSFYHDNGRGKKYPPMPTAIPDEVAAIAARYYPLLSKFNEGYSEDIASECLLKAAWNIHVRNEAGYPIESEKKYIHGALRIAKLRYVDQVQKERNGAIGGNLNEPFIIGIEMTDPTSQITPVAKAETQGDDPVSARKKRRFIRR